MADPLTNPYLQIGLANMMAPNKYIDQKYRDKPLPVPGYYTGNSTGNMGPTDAMGNIIPGFTQNNDRLQAEYQQQLAAWNAAGGGNPAGAPQGQGTTLYSNPITGQPGAPPGQQDNGLTALNDMRNNIVANNLSMQGDPAMRNQGGFGSGNNVMSNTASMQTRDNAIALDQLNRQISQAGQQSGAPVDPRGPMPTPPDLTSTALDALAAPQGIGGHLPTLGAQGVSSPPPQLGQPSVLDSFLANNSAGGKAVAGNYSNAPFFNTLNRLNSGGGGGMLAQNQGQQGPSLGMNVAAPSMGMPGMPTNRNLIGVG